LAKKTQYVKLKLQSIENKKFFFALTTLPKPISRKVKLLFPGIAFIKVSGEVLFLSNVPPIPKNYRGSHSMRSRHGKCFPLLKITRFQGPLDLLILYKEITGHHSFNAFSLYLSQSDDISVLPL
jgi:hypothetical protein